MRFLQNIECGTLVVEGKLHEGKNTYCHIVNLKQALNKANSLTQDVFLLICAFFNFFHQRIIVFRVQIFHLLGLFLNMLFFLMLL